MKKNHYTLFACWAMFFWSTSLRAVFFSLVPAIAITLKFSPSMSGLLLGIFFFGYSSAVWSSGFFPGSRKKVIISGALLSICAFLLMSGLRSFTLFMVVAPLSSFGIGLYLPRGISLIASVSEGHNLGRNMSIHEFASVVGLSLGPLYVGYVLPHFSWGNTLITWGLVGIFALVVFIIVRPQENNIGNINKRELTVEIEHELGKERKQKLEEEKIIQEPGEKRGGKQRFVFDLTFVYLSVIACSMFILLIGLISVIPIMMVESWNLRPDYAASFVGWTRIASIVGIFIAGILSDHHDRFRVLIYVLAASFASLLVMSASGFGMVFTISLIFLFIAAAGTTPVLYAVLAEFYPDNMRDRAVGIISGTGSLLGVVVAPIIFGLLIEHYEPPVTFLAAAVIVFAGIVAIFLVQRLRRENIAGLNIWT